MKDSGIEAQTRIDLGSHAPSVPFVRAIAAEFLGTDGNGNGKSRSNSSSSSSSNGNGIRMRLPLAPRVCTLAAAGRPCIDLRAVVALLDHAGSAAVYAASPSVATATLELRVDITDTVQPGADVVVAAHVAASGHGSALSLGTACNAGAPPFLHLSARYIVGSGPGQAPANAGYLAERAAGVARFAAVGPSAAGSFDDLLGGSVQGTGWTLPFMPPLVGSVTLPALHGGVVAAGLMRSMDLAACDIASHLRLSALTVRYLRAAQAAPTMFTAKVVRAGNRAAFIDAHATQDDRLVATAQALFG